MLGSLPEGVRECVGLLLGEACVGQPRDHLTWLPDAIMLDIAFGSTTEQR